MDDYIACCATDIGTARTVNQDAVSIKVLTKGKTISYMVIVCDGVGGLSEGEYASRCMRERLERWFLYEYPQIALEESPTVIPERLRKTVELQNRLLYEYGLSKSSRCATTVSALLLEERKYYIVHVGDSRIYQLDGSAKQLTEDQTMIAWKVRHGLMTEEEARTARGQNVITQCVGAEKGVEVLLYQGDTDNRQNFLACTDGFYHQIQKEEILDSFWKKDYQSVQELGKELEQRIGQLKSRGERDNISVAAICRKKGKAQ